MGRRGRFAVVVAICSLGIYGEAFAARNWASLRAVKGMEVVIGKINPDALEDGLNPSLLYADVFHSLAMAEIQVLTREERLRTQGCPWLYVSVETVKTKFGSHVYSVSVAVFQDAVLLSNGISTPVQTWEKGSFGMTRSQDLQSIREAVSDLVGLFIKDYLAVNRN
jgi:hypothetical protein